MDIRIRFLNILCLMLLVYPVAVPSIVSNMFYNHLKHDPQKQRQSFWLFSILNFTTIITLIFIQPNYTKDLVAIHYFTLDWNVLIGFLAAPLLILMEFGIGALVTKLQNKKIGSFVVDERIGKEKRWIQVAILIFAVMEELLFRGIGYYIITQKMELPIWVFFMFSASLYAINHIHEGFLTAVQKMLTGFILCFLFVVSKESLLVPIVAHVTENILIIVWSKASYE